MRRAADIAIGSTLLTAIVLAVVRGRIARDVGMAVVGLHLIVAILFVVRRAPKRGASWPKRLIAALSVPTAAVGFALAPSIATWPPLAVAMFIAGATGVGLSLVTLGRSFGVLPAVREMVVAGPFRLVRHPTYASELVMVLACVVAAPTPPLFLVLCAAAVSVAVRIHIEEELLRQDPAYARYASRVRYRLLPLLW